MDGEVKDNAAINRSELLLGGETVAFPYYGVEAYRVVPLHTEVPQALSGQSIGWPGACSKRAAPNVAV